MLVLYKISSKSIEICSEDRRLEIDRGGYRQTKKRNEYQTLVLRRDAVN